MEVCAVFYAMARMQLVMTIKIQTQRALLVMIHRGVGARQVKVKLGRKKLICRKHQLVLLFIESSLRRSGEWVTEFP